MLDLSGLQPVQEPIDLNQITGTASAEAGLIDLDTAPNAKPSLTPKDEEERTLRYLDTASDVLKMSREDVIGAIKSGGEEKLRLDMANALQQRENLRRNNAVIEAAKQYGKAFTPEQYNMMMSEKNAPDPLVVPEKEYSKHYMKLLEASPALSEGFQQATPEEKAAAERVVALKGDFIAKNAIVKKWKEEARATYEKQGWAGWAVDQAKSMVPGHTDYYTRGVVPGVGMVGGGVLRSDNYNEQRKELFRKPLSEFNHIVESTMKDYMATNPTLARDFIESMDGLSSAEELLSDLGMAVDYGLAPGVGTAAKGIKRSVSTGFASVMGKATTQLAESAVNHGASKAAAKAAAGDIAGSAAEQAADEISRGLRGAEFTKATDTLKRLPSMFRSDQENFLANPPSRLAQHQVDDIVEMMGRGGTSITDAIANKVNINRTPILQATQEVIYEGMASEMIKKFRPISEQIFDMSKPIYDQATTTLAVDLKFGASDGHLFAKPELAQRFIKEHGLRSARVEQQGGRWFVSLRQNVDETKPWVKELIAETDVVKNPDSWLNSWIGAIRNPDDILNKPQILARKLATFGQANLLEAAHDIATSFKDLRKGVIGRDAEGYSTGTRGRYTGELTKSQRWDEFNQALTAQRRLPDRRFNDGTIGDTFNDVGEMDHFWMNHFKRLPDPVEVKAYFAFKTITEMDRTVRNLLVVRNMQRRGVENHTVRLRDTENLNVTAYNFDGIKVDKLPSGDDTILILGKGKDDTKVDIASRIIGKGRSKIDQQIATGKKQLLHLWDYDQNTFSNIRAVGNARPAYVLVDKVETKAIRFNQIPRRYGGHFQYEYDSWIKQADIATENVSGTVKNTYLGDKTIMPVAIRAMGQEVAKHLDDIRIALRKGDEAGAKAIYDKFSPTHLEWSTVHGWFKPKRIQGGVEPAMLRLDEPIQVVTGNTKIADMNREAIAARYRRKGADGVEYDTFRDGTSTHGSPAKQAMVEFTDARDARSLNTITNKGTKANPVYTYEPAKFVNPLESMDRAYSKVVNSAYMDDYKIMSVENWLEQATKTGAIKADERQIRFAPFYFFHNADEFYSKGADPALVKNMKIAKAQIESLIGVRSESDNLLHSMAQRIADYTYNKGLPVPIDPMWLLPKLKDPARAIRGLAFHMKLGVFSVPQFIVQLQTYSTILGMAGARGALDGASGAMFSRWAMINSNKKVLDSLDSKMMKFGWKAGEWKESHDALSRSGFLHVGREVAVRDNHLGPQLLKSKYQSVLDWGTVFFTEGERMSRMGAWHAAYKEFRKGRPHGRLSDNDIQSILSRADDMSVNMSRASSSQLHNGWMSVPTQFLSYQIRLAELMIGKRIGWKEKARILGWQSAIYGLPIIPGVFGLPAVEDIKKKALENGYVVGDNWVTSTIMEGVPAALIAMATGKGDMSKGNWYNVQDRLGPKGFETLREATLGDAGFWEVIGGPGLSTAAGIVNAMDPFVEMVKSGLRGDDNLVKVTPQHVFDVFKEISSVNNAWRTIAAINTGRFLSKNELYMADASPTSATFMALTGLSPVSVSDDMLKAWSLKDKKAMEDHVGKRFTKEFRRGLDLAVDHPEQAQRYFDIAYALMQAHIPIEDRPKLQAQAFQDYEKLTSRINQQFYLNRLRPGTEQKRHDAYERVLQQEKNRGPQ